MVGSYSTINAAAEPVMEQTTKIARGVSSAVGRAISKANEEAERNAIKHYAARERYLNQRKLSTTLEEDAVLRATAPVAAPSMAPSVAQASDRSLLLENMATLLKLDAPVPKIDFDAMDQLFPRWRKDKDLLNNEEVLHDLILAVSQLARSHTTAYP